MRTLLAALAFLTACGTFEEPSIVLDLRVLAMRTETLDEQGFPDGRADQVLDVDAMSDLAPADILAEMRPTQITAWVADPAKRDTPLYWDMTLCLADDDGRCDFTLPYQNLGAGLLDDPDDADSPQQPLAIMVPDFTTVAMILRAIEDNPVEILGGVDLQIQMRIGRADEPRENDLYAAKQLRIAPRIPAQRAANNNPRFDMIETAVNGAAGIQLPGNNMFSTRCNDAGVIPPRVRPGDAVTMFPNEAEGTREMYVVPGLDGKAIQIEESVSYQWLATYGSWSDETTGGGHDVLGNQSLLGSDWTAPRLGSGSGPLDVSLWMIQRDERLGVTMFETCVTVMP